MVPVPADPDTMEDGKEWFEDDVLELLRVKVQALKKLCATLLEHSGSLNSEIEEDPKFMSRLRLEAAVSMLHLATVEKFATVLTPKFLRLAVVIQDSGYSVLYLYLTKLLTLLQPRKIPPQFNIIPFLTVHPERDIKTLASTYVESAKKRLPPALRTEHLEIIFIRLLHLLAHHPDFSTAHDDLLDIVKYLQFYLDLIATQDNVSLLHHLALKAKTVRDAESHSENFYITAQLAQELIKKKAQEKSWTIQTYPGKVRLPPDILRPLPSSEAGKEILKTTYLPEETRRWLDELGKAALPKEKKERKAPVKRKAPATKASGQSKRRRKKARSREDDEDESAGEESNEEEAEENEDSEMDVDEKPPTSEDVEETPRPRGTRTSARNKTKTKAKKRRSSPQTDPDDEDE